MRHGAVRGAWCVVRGAWCVVRGIFWSILAPAFHRLRTTDVGLSPCRCAMG
jgi:hypothetical protein